MRTAFEFAVSRGYARENPVVRTAEVKVDHTPPGILLPREIAAFLAEADSTIVPAIALAAFAGLRDAELDRMTWERIDLAGGWVKLDASVAKTSSRRIIPISDNLRAWLAPHAKSEGPIRAGSSVSSPLYRTGREAAVKTLAKSKVAAPNLKQWPHNALRHSFASYRMAIVTNAAQVAEECGHSVQVMKTHYRELVTKMDSEAWFAVVPMEKPENIVQFDKRAAG
jgi:integrase